MTRSTVLVGGVAVTVSTDVRLTTGPDAHWTVAMARVVDELTGAAPTTVLMAIVEERGFRSRLGDDGQVGVLIQPWHRYPLIAAPGFAVHVKLGAPGFLPRRVAIPIVRTLAGPAVSGDTVITIDTTAGILPGQVWTIGDPAAIHERVSVSALGPGVNQVTIPPLVNGYGGGAAFAPGPLTSIDLGDVALHRSAFVVRGRVMTFVTATRTWEPPPAATLALTAIWRRQADVTNELAKQPPNLVAVAPGLYRDRAAADMLQPVAIANIGGDEKTMGGSVVPGETRARVSNAKGLAPASTLQIDIDHPDAIEMLPVATATPDGTVDEPASVDFTLPFARDHRSAIGVHHVNAANTLAGKALADDALAGDPVVFLADVAFGGTPATARVGAGPTAEYQTVSLFDDIAADADGYFQFPPLARVAKVRITATVAPHPPLELDLEPDPRVTEQWLAVNVA